MGKMKVISQGLFYFLHLRTEVIPKSYSGEGGGVNLVLSNRKLAVQR